MHSRAQSPWSRAALAVALWALVCAAAARGPAPDEIAIAELPPEAQDVLARIRTDGPFRYDRDGIVFGNRERRLPPQSRGYYHEYTVPTPGVKTRGARRIICGGPRTTPHVCYYTSDHYETFRRIRE